MFWCFLAHCSLFFFIASLRRVFLTGRRAMRFSSAKRLRTVLFETFITSLLRIVVRRATLFLRFWMHIFLIFRSVREMVILFLPHFPIWPAFRGLFRSILILILFTADFGTPTIVDISFWVCLEWRTSACISLHFLELMS